MGDENVRSRVSLSMSVGPFVSKISSINLTFVIYDVYSSPNIIRAIKSRTRWAGKAARMGRGAYRVLVWKPEGKRPLGRLT